VARRRQLPLGRRRQQLDALFAPVRDPAHLMLKVNTIQVLCCPRWRARLPL
jgi:hypothetical protein